MSLNKSAVCLSKLLLIPILLILSGCNPYRQTIRIKNNDKDILWGIHPANLEFRKILQDHFLMRDPVGSSCELFYETSTGNSKGIKISFNEMEIDFIPEVLKIPALKTNTNTFLKIGSYGVWTITEFTPQTRMEFLGITLPELNNLKGLIIDLRQNRGGHDAIAAELAAYFIKEETLYEETRIKDINTGAWQDLGHIIAYPQKNSTFHFPIIILISPLCNGTGEGFVNILQKEENIQTLGMSLDENGYILLESPGDYGGGIFPDIRSRYPD